MKTISSCFAILRQYTLYPTISAANRSSVVSDVVPRPLSRLDYGNAIHLVQRLQTMMNAAARMIYSTSRLSQISPFLRQLHWLKARERNDYKLAVLAYKCLRGTGPAF